MMLKLNDKTQNTKVEHPLLPGNGAKILGGKLTEYWNYSKKIRILTKESSSRTRIKYVHEELLTIPINY